ncbi:MAG: PHP domain-containing protein [Candidatus Cloacimonetes bacterium]|nr:PHP domain-containing protein [Candidatus Cloacimonadota bacterium]
MKIKNILGRSYIELTGCIHNHTEYSYDSRVPLSRIINVAKKAELDFITINDHRNLEAAHDPAVVMEKELIIICGVEINDPDNNNHYLVFNTDKVLKGKSAREYVEFYRQTGAIGFAAHPLERRASKRFRKYIWTDLDNDGFDGMEIWNFVSEWIGKLKPSFNGLWFILFPSLFVVKPLPEVIIYWDRLNSSGKRKSAIGSVDSHEEKVKKFGILFKFLTHKSLFNSIRTNVLLPSATEITDKTILAALRKGNSYIVNHKMGNPYNFFAGMSSGDDKSIIFGEELSWKENLKIFYRLPCYCRINLIRNGRKISAKIDDKGFFLIKKPGNYRLEIFKWGRAWIYTNNFYII